MPDTKIEPHKIKSPIQLLAVWFAALVLIDTALLTAATQISAHEWIAPTLVISAIAFVPIFLVCAIVMQTKFRPQLQEDSYYSEWLERRETLFMDFAAENFPLIDAPTQLSTMDETWQDREPRRIGKYQVQEGLFLVHAWRPSTKPGQVADIVIWLHQHSAGPMNRDEVEKVEYHLGPLFFTKSVLKHNHEQAFKLEISAYYPMLCLARVYLRNRSDLIELERYIDFHVPGAENFQLSEKQPPHLLANTSPDRI
jgi:hypothetical protein